MAYTLKDGDDDVKYVTPITTGSGAHSSSSAALDGSKWLGSRSDRFNLGKKRPQFPFDRMLDGP
jgi:hypothetical protein